MAGMTRILRLPALLCAAFALLGAVAVGATPQKETTAGQATLVWANHSVGPSTPQDIDLWTAEIAKLSGIKVKLVKVPDDQSVLKISTMLAAGEQLDLAYLDWDRFDEVVKDNPTIFEPLDARVTKSKVFGDTAKFPVSFWEKMKKPDGHIYAVRFDNNWGQGGTLSTVRWDWVEKLGYGPKFDNNRKLTLDDYYQLMRDFTLKDPDGNGRADTYGLALAGTLYETQPFFGSVGAIRLYAMDKSGKVYSPMAQDNTKPVWAFLARLYAEKILEPNFVTNGSGDFANLFMTDRVGLINYWANSLAGYNSKVQTAKPGTTFHARPLWPPVGPDGTALLRTGAPRIDAIPAASKNKDLAFQLLEFFQTDKGALVGSVGIEGYDYNWEGNKLVRIGDRGAPHGMTPGWNWTPPWDVSPDWLEALKITSALVRPELAYGRSGDQWEEVIGVDGARIIRGEVSVDQGLIDMRKRFKDQGLTDY